MQKVLVTGGAGYVGTTLLPLLLQEGYKVRVMDSLLFGGDSLFPFLRHPNFEFQLGDVRDAQALQNAVRDVDAVIHLAAIVGYPACRRNPQLATETNVDGTRNLINATSRDQLILFGSTGSNYGSVEEICTEETPLQPLSLYGQTKTLAEAMLLQERNTVAFRFATAFGVSPRLRLDLLINDLTYKAVTQKYLVVYERHFMRTFIHVHDMGRAFVFAMRNADRMVNHVFNIGSDSMNYSKADVCEKIRQHTEVYIHYADVGSDEDKRNYVVSYDKVRALGYDVSIDIDTGIEELIRTVPLLNIKTPYSNIG